MGRAPAPTNTYRDDPDAVSMHTTPDDYNYDDAPEISGLPPSYADSEVENSSASAPLIRHVSPPSGRMDHCSTYSMKFGKPQVNETQTLMDTRYDTDPDYLEEAVRSLAKDAPFPLVYIMGTHRETVRRGDKKEKKEIVDFRIVMDMQRCLKRAFNDNDSSMMKFSTAENGEKTYRGTVTKQRAPGVKQDIEVGTPKPELKEWCHRFCASDSSLKVFRIRREVTGFDETQLKNQIEGLIRSTNYRGKIIIGFPVELKNIDIYSSNRINEWRLKTWIRWAFYLSFLWIFSWPYLFFATKRYSVVKAEWPFSTTDRDGVKTYTTVSEQQWYEKWHVGIRRLVLDRYQGEASEDMLRGVIARPEDPPMPGTIRTGLQGVDNAVGLLTQGFQVARAIQTGDNLSRGLQGGWGYDS